MPRPRPIPSVNTKEYSEQGAVYVKPQQDSVVLEMHFCSAFLDQRESLALMMTFLTTAKKVWGEEFTNKVLFYAEKL